MKQLLAILLLVLFVLPTKGMEWLDTLDDALSWSMADGTVQTDLSFMSDVETFWLEQPYHGTAGFITDDVYLHPKLSAFLDMQAGETLNLHLLARWDRGFDTGSVPDGEVRLDEYYLNWKPLADDRLAVRAGKFATVFGAWVPRHLSWENPFVTAPLAYDDMLPLTDGSAPTSLEAFAARRNVADTPATWVPIIWGPSYATGASVSGRISEFDYAFEIKNAALSSRPESWDAVENNDFRTPVNVTGRIGWRPSAEWALGSSFSHGPWMIEGDAKQTTVGIDASYAYAHLQLWSEVIWSRFEVPGIGDVQVTSAFLEAKYKLSARWWMAARWNQSWNGDIPGLRDGLSFDRDAWRLDLAAGFRLSRHAQLKLQYSLADKRGDHPEGQHLLALQCTLRF